MPSQVTEQEINEVFTPHFEAFQDNANAEAGKEVQFDSNVVRALKGYVRAALELKEANDNPR